MLLEEQEVNARFESPLNLLNRLRTAAKPNSSSRQNIIPSLPPTSDDVIEDLEEKLQSNSIKAKASTILLSALNELEIRIPEIHKPESLSRVAESMNKIVSSETEKSGSKGGNIGQIIIYSPAIMKESQFETIDVSHRE